MTNAETKKKWQPPDFPNQKSEKTTTSEKGEKLIEKEELKLLDLTIKPLPKDMKKTYLAAKKVGELG